MPISLRSQVLISGRLSDLDTAARTIVRDSLGVAPGESLLVVCDPTTHELGIRLRDEGERAGADAVLALMAERETNGEDPAAPVSAAMAAADVVLAPTARSISHSEARRRATEAGARIATLPGVTEEMLARVMSVDMDELKRLTHAIAERLDAASEARITCPNGSDLTLSLDGREGIPDDGRLTEPRAFGNLPAGEGFIAPLEDRAEGTLVVDGSIADIGLMDEPVELTIEGGRLTTASGEPGRRLYEMLSAHGGENVAELGVGANDRAVITGNVLEDEKVLGTVHVAFGASAGFGGVVKVPVHIDCVILKPELTVDGEPLVSGGRLLV
jgi:leucyl aminopeptidase (aminopeptidase T)